MQLNKESINKYLRKNINFLIFLSDKLMTLFMIGYFLYAISFILFLAVVPLCLMLYPIIMSKLLKLLFVIINHYCLYSLTHDIVKDEQYYSLYFFSLLFLIILFVILKT